MSELSVSTGKDVQQKGWGWGGRLQTLLAGRSGGLACAMLKQLQRLPNVLHRTRDEVMWDGVPGKEKVLFSYFLACSSLLPTRDVGVTGGPMAPRRRTSAQRRMDRGARDATDAPRSKSPAARCPPRPPAPTTAAALGDRGGVGGRVGSGVGGRGRSQWSCDDADSGGGRAPTALRPTTDRGGHGGQQPVAAPPWAAAEPGKLAPSPNPAQNRQPGVSASAIVSRSAPERQRPDGGEVRVRPNGPARVWREAYTACNADGGSATPTPRASATAPFACGQQRADTAVAVR